MPCQRTRRKPAGFCDVAILQEVELLVKNPGKGKSRMSLQRRLVEAEGRLIKCTQTLCLMNRSPEAQGSISWRYSFNSHIRNIVL
jgi:hypothetical protein